MSWVSRSPVPFLRGPTFFLVCFLSLTYLKKLFLLPWMSLAGFTSVCALINFLMVQHNTSSCWLLYHLEKDVNAFQESPGLPASCCAVPLTYGGVVEVPHEDEELWVWGCSNLSVEELMLSFPGWVAVPTVMAPVPALPLILTCTQAGHWYRGQHYLLVSSSCPS